MHLLRRYEAACHRRLERAMHKLASVRRPATTTPPKSLRELYGDPTSDPEPIEIEEDDEVDEDTDSQDFEPVVEDSAPSIEETPVAPAPEVSPSPSVRADAPRLSMRKYAESSFAAPASPASSFVAVSAVPSSPNIGAMACPHGHTTHRRS